MRLRAARGAIRVSMGRRGRAARVHGAAALGRAAAQRDRRGGPRQHPVHGDGGPPIGVPGGGGAAHRPRGRPPDVAQEIPVAAPCRRSSASCCTSIRTDARRGRARLPGRRGVHCDDARLRTKWAIRAVLAARARRRARDGADGHVGGDGRGRDGAVVTGWDAGPAAAARAALLAELPPRPRWRTRWPGRARGRLHADPDDRAARRRGARGDAGRDRHRRGEHHDVGVARGLGDAAPGDLPRYVAGHPMGGASDPDPNMPPPPCSTGSCGSLPDEATGSRGRLAAGAVGDRPGGQADHDPTRPDEPAGRVREPSPAGRVDGPDEPRGDGGGGRARDPPAGRRGFRDLTRLAASDAALWSAILLANRERIAEAIDLYVERLRAAPRRRRRWPRGRRGITVRAGQGRPLAPRHEAPGAIGRGGPPGRGSRPAGGARGAHPAPRGGREHRGPPARALAGRGPGDGPPPSRRPPPRMRPRSSRPADSTRPAHVRDRCERA